MSTQAVVGVQAMGPHIPKENVQRLIRNYPFYLSLGFLRRVS